MKKYLFIAITLFSFGAEAIFRPATAGIGTGISGQSPLDALAPRLVIEPLPDFTTVRGGETLVFRWTCEETNASAVDSLHIAKVLIDGTAADSLIFSPSETGSTWEWTAPELISSQCYLQVESEDLFGNRTVALSDRFTVLTSTTDVPSALAPAAALLPPRPNPFNPSTRISFTLTSAGDVRLELFDARGRRVRLLDAGPRTAGEHVVSWNGTDDAGRRLAAGAYLVRLAWRGDNADLVRCRKVVMVP